MAVAIILAASPAQFLPGQADAQLQDPTPQDPVEKPEDQSDLANTTRFLLRADPAIGSDRVKVRASRGVIELSGNLDNLRAARRAVLLAQSVDGVFVVVDRVTVQRHADHSEALADRVTDALGTDPLTEGIEVQVENLPGGGIRLTTPDTGVEAERLRDVAEAVAGVQQVVVEAGTPIDDSPADSDIKGRVEMRFARDVWLDQAILKVQVVEGAVQLSGQVDDQDLKQRAVSLANVPGASQVDASALMVMDKPTDPALRRALPEAVDDETLRAALDHALEIDPRVVGHNLAVEVENGEVSITGTAPTQVALDAAAQNARNSVGVASVNIDATVTDDSKDGERSR